MDVDIRNSSVGITVGKRLNGLAKFTQIGGASNASRRLPRNKDRGYNNAENNNSSSQGDLTIKPSELGGGCAFECGHCHRTRRRQRLIRIGDQGHRRFRKVAWWVEIRWC